MDARFEELLSPCAALPMSLWTMTTSCTHQPFRSCSSILDVSRHYGRELRATRLFLAFCFIGSGCLQLGRDTTAIFRTVHTQPAESFSSFLHFWRKAVRKKACCGGPPSTVTTTCTRTLMTMSIPR